MSADLLRRAAASMRERASVGPDQPWSVDSDDQIVARYTLGEVVIADYVREEWTEHIASWHPAVALAVAKAMDDVAHAWEICDGWTHDLDYDPLPFEDTVDAGWVAVARAYLGESV